MNAHTAIIVGKNGVLAQVKAENIEAAAEVRGFKVIGYTGAVAPGMHKIAYREELVGQPIFDKLQGPMYGGEGIVRYETIAAYEELSR